MKLITILSCCCCLAVFFSAGVQARKMAAPTSEESTSEVKKACECPPGAMCKCRVDQPNDDATMSNSSKPDMPPPSASQGKISYSPGQVTPVMPEDNCQPGRPCI